MSEAACCAYSDVVSKPGQECVTSVRRNVAESMRQLGEIEFTGWTEVARGWRDSEARSAEDKSRLLRVMMLLMQVAEGIERVIRGALPTNSKRTQLFGWTREIGRLWDDVSTLYHAFTWLESATNIEERSAAIRQIKWGMVGINERLGKCNTKRAQCVKWIACPDHVNNLPIFGTLHKQECCTVNMLCTHKRHCELCER